jgi:hypothetical protein
MCVSDADTITHVLQEYHERISSLEDVKFDLEYAVKKKDYEVELCYFLFSPLLQLTSFVVANFFIFISV